MSGPTQEYPYPGHKASCKLTAEWRKAQEDVWVAKNITETLEIIHKLKDNLGDDAEMKLSKMDKKGNWSKPVAAERCDKCQTDMGFGWSRRDHEVKLMGGYYANLCTECRNAWDQHLREKHSDIRTRQSENIAKQHALTQVYKTLGADYADEFTNKLTPLVLEYNMTIKDDLFDAAKAWIADKTAVATP